MGLWGMLAILASFSLAGPTIFWVGRPLLFSLLPARSPTWLRVAAYVVVMPPLYQFFLLVYGALLGQFRFFWEREKKLGRFLLRVLGLRRPRPESESGQDPAA